MKKHWLILLCLLLSIMIGGIFWWMGLISYSHKEDHCRFMQPEEIYQQEHERRNLYTLVERFLIEEGNRKKAAEVFDELAKKYVNNSKFSQEFQELADLLKKMAIEDANWKEPKDISNLSLNEQINYYIYKLRDVRYRQLDPFHMCSTCELDRIIDTSRINETLRKNRFFAIKLEEIGEPVIPFLINLLNDCRPTRAIFIFRCISSLEDNWVMRYQDEALQILIAIKPEIADLIGKKIYCLSAESSDYRHKIITEIKAYWEKTQEKPNDKEK